MYKIIIKRKPQRFLDKITKTEKIRIAESILDLKYDPTNGDIKKLSGEFKGFYRLRVGKTRILFTKDTTLQELTIHIIDNRGDVY